MSLVLYEKFKLSFRDIFYNPYYIIRTRLYNAIKLNADYMQGSMIDFGCGTRPYEHLFSRITKYTGVDFEGGGNPYNKAKVDVYYNGSTLPFSDGEYDNVLTTEVIEHVFNPDEIIKELNRVLKPGGLLLLTCPFAWPEHEQPWDYARYSSFGIKHLLEKNGFKIIRQEKTGNFLLCLTQLTVMYLYMLIPKVVIIQQILFLIFCFPTMLLGLSLNKILPKRVKRSDLYLNNLVLAEKIN
ncbi:MAG: class I SAM-dependent methyltransferase [Chitinophagaceae bacterium]|nr:class I SAM-dependent methyltransferase [Chitinophagaceae bacterium]